MKKEYSFLYLVDWGNKFVGGYDEKFEQVFNTTAASVFDDLRILGVKCTKIITPVELATLRGYHKPTLQEYLGG